MGTNIELEQLIELVRQEQPVLGDKSLKVIEICHRLMGGTQVQKQQKTPDTTNKIRLLLMSLIELQNGTQNKSEVYVDKRLAQCINCERYNSVSTDTNVDVSKLKGLSFVCRIRVGENSIHDISMKNLTYLILISDNKLYVVDDRRYAALPQRIQDEIRAHYESKTVFIIKNKYKDVWTAGFFIAEAVKALNSIDAKSLGYLKL